ncbi:MAG: metallophosphoesterase [Nitrospirae bacterium]|nr:metallophosphoesterase [Nitrospirota bacterium]
MSDLHIGDKYRNFLKRFGYVPYNPDALVAVAEFAYKQKNEYDAIIVSGDVVSVAYKDNLVLAKSFFETDTGLVHNREWLYSESKPTLASCQKPVIIMPGNHDKFKGILGFPVKKPFENVFKKYWKSDRIQVYKLPSENDPQLGIVCVDLTLNSFIDSTVLGGHFGQGRLYDDEIEDLKNITKKTKEMSAVTWMIHFAPCVEEHFELEDIEEMRLLNSETLIKTARELGIRYIFCGHTHIHHNYMVSKDIEVLCCGTTACVEGNKVDTTMFLHEIDIDGLDITSINSKRVNYDIVRQEFTYDIVRQEFTYEENDDKQMLFGWLK